MKKTIFLSAAVCALLSSCKKEADQINILPQPTVSAFRVTGVSDVVFNKSPFGFFYDTWQMPLGLVYGNGEPQRVTLSFSGIPQGIEDSITIKSGYPDFSTMALLYYKDAANGDYQATLAATPDSGKALSYKFNIKVEGDTSCAGYFTSKSFKGSSTCNTSPAGYNVSFTKSGLGGDTLFLNNFDNTGSTLKVVVNCANRFVVVPLQTIQNFNYQGSGQINSGSFPNFVYVNLLLSKYDTNGNYMGNCNYTFQ